MNRQLRRAKRPRTRDGFVRQIARLAIGGPERVAKAEARRESKRARMRAILQKAATTPGMNAYEVDQMMREGNGG